MSKTETIEFYSFRLEFYFMTCILFYLCDHNKKKWCYCVYSFYISEFGGSNWVLELILLRYFLLMMFWRIFMFRIISSIKCYKYNIYHILSIQEEAQVKGAKLKKT